MRMWSDSGVVINTSGKAVLCLAFSLADVSPVLVPTSQSNPKPLAISLAASAMSADNALNGAIPNELDSRTTLSLMDGMCKHVTHGRIRFATARWGLQQSVAPLTCSACQTSRWKG